MNILSIDVISAFLSASCPHCNLAVARYAFDNNMTNLLETNTNLTSILMTDLGSTVAQSIHE